MLMKSACINPSSKKVSYITEYTIQKYTCYLSVIVTLQESHLYQAVSVDKLYLLAVITIILM